jgi:hypothetical protein
MEMKRHRKNSKIQNIDNITCWQRCGVIIASHSLLLGMPNITATVAVSHKTKHTCNQAIQQLHFLILPKEVENFCPQKKSLTQMFVTALFTIAKTWELTKMSLRDERINK